ncbi:MAG TPA: PPC domain-containing protein, partial [Phototrophicaceae bacterium]|nr:PPC domain-containing protein [Phototrophicaceae bacterium]
MKATMKFIKILLAATVITALLMASSVILAQRDEINPGDTIEDELTKSVKAYDFEGEAGSWVTFTLESTDFDPKLIIEDSDGNEVASDDDSGGNSNARIFFPVPTNDTYTIKVTSYLDDSRGSFVLRAIAVDAVVLESGEENEITFDDETAKYFKFEGKQDDTYNIIVTTDESDSLDTRLT